MPKGGAVSKSQRSTSHARWALQDAKNKLSEVVDAAARRGRIPPLAAYLLAMPTTLGPGATIERIELETRDPAF